MTLSVETLFKSFGNKITFGTIEESYQEETDTHYYDLYNDSQELACMDGEDVEVDQKTDSLITLRNRNGEGDVYFNLSPAEYNLGISIMKGE